MNVNPLVISALRPILGVDPSPNKYTGSASEYITFNYADERPEVYADDEDLLDSTIIQVHFFTKGNPQTNKKAIRRLLRDAGFMIQSTQEIYENDTGYTHVIVYAWIDGIIDD
jgi:hypothetical protein